MEEEEEEKPIEVLKLLVSSAIVERTKGVQLLEEALTKAEPDRTQPIETGIIQLLNQHHHHPNDGGHGGHGWTGWEPRHGALMGARALVSHPTHRPSSCEDFYVIIKDRAVVLLNDDEYRVRLAAGDLIGAFCQKYGCQIYTDISEIVFKGIAENLNENGPLPDRCTHSAPDSPDEVRCTSAKKIFNDTSNWKHLETWLKCLQCMIEGCGLSFNIHINVTLLDLLAKALNNWSRFVREACCGVLGALVGCNVSQENTLMMTKEESAIYQNAEVISNQLQILLSDPYSEVKMCASLVVRKFLLGLPDDAVRQTCLAILLPPLCFNRYYTAEGVRLHTQETWVLATRGEGKALVERNINYIIEFDIQQLSAGSHEIRETACTCIREMVQKLSPHLMEPFVVPLLSALRDCLTSNIWTVRDATFVTCGAIISSFPLQSKELFESLNEYFLVGLEDNAAPVREAAAIALGCTVKAYGNEVIPAILAKIKTGFDGVAHEKTDEKRRHGGDSVIDSTTSGSSASLVVDRATPSSCCCPVGCAGKTGPHEVTALQSQVSLLKHGRPPELWELADGCLCLMCELAQQPICAKDVTKLLPALAKAASYNHYSQHVFFLQSFCKQLPILFKSLGKSALKLYVEIFFDVVFTSAGSDKTPVATAALECIVQLSDLLGSNVFRARVESYNPRYLQYLK